MTKRRVHLAFGDSVAGTLREVLAAAGRDEAVLAFRDCYGMGPINPPDPAARAAWFRAELDYVFAPGESLADDTAAFWQAALDPAVLPIVWATRTTACEYPGLLAWNARAEGREWRLVDLTDRVIVRADGSRFVVRAVGTVRAAGLARFLDAAVVLPASQADADRALWARLQAEGAMLRAITDDGIVSVPLDHFDPALIACATDEWQVAARLVGTLLMEQERSGCFQTGDLFLAARLRRLAAAGLLEADGDTATLRGHRLRLPGRG